MNADGVQILDRFLDPRAVSSAYPGFRRWGRIPHGLFFCSVARLRRRALGITTASAAFVPYFGPLTGLILDHLQRLLDALPTPVQGPSAGVELWLGCNGPHDDHVYVHMDTHSGAHRPGPEPRPAFGSILYLGPAELRGGSTYLCPVQPIPPRLVAANRTRLPFAEALAAAPRWIEVEPEPGRLVIFDGRLPHFRAPVAIDAAADQPRIVLLANVWRHMPMFTARADPIARLTPREFELFTSMRRGDAAVLRDLVERYPPDDLDALARVSRRLYASAG